MDKELIDKEIKHEVELIKVFTVFIISLGTGDMSLLIRDDFFENRIAFYSFIAGVIPFIIFVRSFILSYLKIVRLIKQLRS
jgi:hypothetical protein